MNSHSSMSGPIPSLPAHMMGGMANSSPRFPASEDPSQKDKSKRQGEASKASVWTVACLLSFIIFFLAYVRETSYQQALAECTKTTKLVDSSGESEGEGDAPGPASIPSPALDGTEIEQQVFQKYQDELMAVRAELSSVQHALDNTEKEKQRHEEEKLQLQQDKSQFLQEQDSLLATVERLKGKMIEKAAKRDEYLEKLVKHGIADPNTKIRSQKKRGTTNEDSSNEEKDGSKKSKAKEYASSGGLFRTKKKSVFSKEKESKNKESSSSKRDKESSSSKKDKEHKDKEFAGSKDKKSSSSKKKKDDDRLTASEFLGIEALDSM